MGRASQNADNHSCMLNAPVRIIKLCANAPDIRPNGERYHFSKPSGRNDFDIIVHQREHRAFGAADSGVVQGGIIESALVPKYADPAIAH